MKSIKKVLAMALALAMVVTAVPVTSAQAASTAKLSASKVTVAKGDSKSQTKTVKVTTPSSWKSVKVTATSKNKKIAKTSVSGKTVKVRAVKKGSTTVTVKVTAKKNGKKVTKSLKLTAKVVAANLAISASDVTVGSAANVSVTKKVPAAATVTYTSSDEKIATVSADGVVTGVATGTVTITATSNYGPVATADVTVAKSVLRSVKQTKVDTIVADIVGDTSALVANDFKITNTSTNATVPVKSVTVDKADSTKVTLETYTEMKDGKTYEVVLDGVTQSFTATDGTVAGVGLTKTEIPAGEATKVQATSVDANGVILKSFNLTNANTGASQVSADLTITKGYVDGEKVYLPSVGDTMTAKLTYHTGTYGTDGTESGIIEQTFTITAIDPALVNYSFALTIGTSNPSWGATSFKANTNLKLGATTQQYAYFKITNDDGEDIENYDDYSVETADATKVVLNVTKLGNVSAASGSDGVAVTGVSEGDTYLIVKKSDNVVASLAISVQGKPVGTSATVAPTSVTLMQGTSEKSGVTISVLDQYGDPIAVNDDSSLDVKLLSAPSKATSVAQAAEPVKGTTKAEKGKIVVTASASDYTSKETAGSDTYKNENSNNQGTYVYSVTMTTGSGTYKKELVRTFSVVVVKYDDTNPNYQLSVGQTSVDTTVNTQGEIAEEAVDTFVVKMQKTKNGAVISDVDSSEKVAYTVRYNGKTIHNDTISITDVDDVTTPGVKVTPNVVTQAGITADGNKLSVTPVDDSSYTVNSATAYVKSLDAGTYSVTATMYALNAAGTKWEKVISTNTFTIVDNQDTNVQVDFEETQNVTSIKDAFEDYTNAKLVYDGQKLTKYEVLSVVTAKAGNAVQVTSASIFVPINNGSVYVLVNTNMSKYFVSTSESTPVGTFPAIVNE